MVYVSTYNTRHINQVNRNIKENYDIKNINQVTRNLKGNQGIKIMISKLNKIIEK